MGMSWVEMAGVQRSLALRARTRKSNFQVALLALRTAIPISGNFLSESICILHFQFCLSFMAAQFRSRPSTLWKRFKFFRVGGSKLRNWNGLSARKRFKFDTRHPPYKFE